MPLTLTCEYCYRQFLLLPWTRECPHCKSAIHADTGCGCGG